MKDQRARPPHRSPAVVELRADFDGATLGQFWFGPGARPALLIGDAPDVTLACATADLPASRFPLLRRRADGYELSCPEAALGSLCRDGAPVTLAELCAAGRANRACAVRGERAP